MGRDDLLCLARCVGLNTTPLDLCDLERSAEWDSLDKASNIAVFSVSCFRLRCHLGLVPYYIESQYPHPKMKSIMLVGVFDEGHPLKP